MIYHRPQVVILCGGRGERLGETTEERPKPMVTIGGRPILWHIMRNYLSHGFGQFILAVGYLGWMVEDYFAAERVPARWAVRCESTGWETQNGGRLKRLAPLLTETFCLAWCDGLSDLDLTAMLAFHRSHGKLCTVATVQPPERFGSLAITWNDTLESLRGRVTEFHEKAQAAQWINAGFFVCEPGVLRYIDGDVTQWERDPMERLAKDGELMAFAHGGFWQCMDTEKDRRVLNELWAAKQAPWKTWED